MTLNVHSQTDSPLGNQSVLVRAQNTGHIHSNTNQKKPVSNEEKTPVPLANWFYTEKKKTEAYYQFFGSVLDVGDEIWVLSPLKPEYLQIVPVN